MEHRKDRKSFSQLKREIADESHSGEKHLQTQVIVDCKRECDPLPRVNDKPKQYVFINQETN